MLKRQILLVEDNPDDEELTLIALRKSSIPSKVDVVRDSAPKLLISSLPGDYANRTLPHAPVPLTNKTKPDSCLKLSVNAIMLHLN